MRSELEQSPAMTGKQLIVLTLARPGYKQPQQLMTIAYLLALGAEFDVVLNPDGFYDIVLPVVENIPSGTFPFYPRSWNLLVSRVDDLNLLSRMGEIAYARAQQADAAAALLGSWLRYSVTANVTWALLDHLWSSRAFRFERALQTGTDVPRSYQRNGPLRKYRDDDEMYRDLAAVWRNASLQLSRLGRENGFLYLHFLQPNQYDVDSKPLSAEERASAYDPSHPYAKAAQPGYPYLRAAGRELSELGVSFHDLTRIFADDRRTLYADTCCHLNREGARTLGARMGAILRESLEQR
jgi:hypothetical protein